MENPTPPDLTTHELSDLGYAVKNLGEAFFHAPDRMRVVNLARQAANNIAAFLGAQQQGERLTDKECEWSRGLHTCLRKYDDSPVSCILYKMIAENRADPVWREFIHVLVKTKNIREALDASDRVSDDGPTDWMIFQQSLRIWNEGKGMKSAVKTVADWEKEEENSVK